MANMDISLNSEEKNKKKGITISIIVHILLLLLALWPLMDTPIEIEKNFAIIVEFEKPKVVPKKLGGGPKSAKSSEGSASETAPKKETKTQTPAEQPKRVKTTKVIHIDNTTPRPQPKPAPKVLTTPDINVPSRPDPVKETEVLEPKTKTTKVPTNKTKTPTSLDDFLPEIDKIIEAEKNRGSTSGAGGQGDDSNPERGDGIGGKGDGDGKGNKDNGGKASGSGTGDDDLPPGDEGDGSSSGPYRGEGPLSRQIKIRADCFDKLKYNGKIVIELCINQAGQITYARGSRKKSDIKSRSMVRQLTNCWKKGTVFYKDMDAPYKECGTYTYRIDIQN